MGKRTREAKAKAAAEAESGSAPAAPFLALQDKDEGLDAIFAKTFAPVEKSKPVPLQPKTAPKVIEEEPKVEKKEKSKKRKAPSPVPRDPNDPEEVYIAKQAAKRLKAAAEPVKKTTGSRVVESASEESEVEVDTAAQIQSDEDSDVEDGQAAAEALAAESDTEPEPTASTSKPPKPSSDPDRDARTAFIGNLPLAAATSKPLKKSLHAHLATFTTSKIESIRYRSLPLASTEPVEKKKPAENHSTKRAKEWAEQSLRKGGSRTDVNPNHVSKDEKETIEAPKVFLTPAQKRKVAFITGDHLVDGEKNAGASCNAYVVLASSEGVQELITGANGKIWEGRTLRVDKVEKSKKDWQEEKRTVFVGGLAFEEGEEALRKWMEATLIKEKGEETGGWVESVRIIRDKQTGLGKGFAYVLLKDKDCVDEVLALDPAQCKMDKRKLRFDRCKNAAKLEALKKIAERKEKAKTTSSKDPKKAYNADAAPIKKKKPAADLGKELEGKPKDERKAIKSADIDRVQRRLEKKQKKSQELKRESRKKQRSEADLLKRAGQRIKGVEKAGVKKGAKKVLKKSA